MKERVAKKEKQDANECSKSVASHVQREAMYAWEQIYMLEYPTPLSGMVSSLTTNIRLSVTQRRLYQTELLMLVLVAPTSSTSRSSLIEEGYIYDLSSYACERDENKCHFHTYVKNSKTLHVVGQGKFCVKRVNAPVPDYIVMNQLMLLWRISLRLISTNRKWRFCRKLFME